MIQRTRGRRDARMLMLSAVTVLLIAGMFATEATATTGVAYATSDGQVPWGLTAKCQLSPPVTRDLSNVEYVVTASAEAEGPAVGTYVGCHVYGNGPGIRTGGCSGGGAGPAAVCAGSASGYLHVVPSVCVEAWALYADGSTARTRPCP